MRKFRNTARIHKNSVALKIAEIEGQQDTEFDDIAELVSGERGLEMLLRADFIVAAEHAEFMLPEARIGMAPDAATFMLPRMLPRQKAFELLMTGRRKSAREMAALGIVNEVAPAAEFMDRARALAQDLLKAEPLSLAAIKEAVQLTENMTFEECFAALRSRSWPAFMKMLESSDAKEGAKAFVEKRAPVWKGE